MVSNRIKMLVLNAVSSGCRTVSDMISSTGLGYGTVHMAIIELGLEDRIHRKYGIIDRNRLEEMAMAGENLRTMCQNVGNVTHEAVRLYLINAGLHDKWKKIRKEKKEGKRNTKVAVNALSSYELRLYNERAYSLAEKEGWNTWAIKALNYYLETSTINDMNYLQKLDILFTVYGDAFDNNKKLSVGRLAEISGFKNGASALDILRKSGLKPLFRELDRHVTPKYKKEKIIAASELGLSATDISFFLGVGEYVVEDYWRRGKLRSGIANLLMRLGIYGPLTYRKASEIYEAQDAGFTREETLYLLDTNGATYDFAARNRNVIEPKIKDVIDFLWPEFKPHKNPYLTHPASLEEKVSS